MFPQAWPRLRGIGAIGGTAKARGTAVSAQPRQQQQGPLNTSTVTDTFLMTGAINTSPQLVIFWQAVQSNQTIQISKPINSMSIVFIDCFMAAAVLLLICTSLLFSFLF